MKHLASMLVLMVMAACGGDDARAVDIPVVAANAFEADCQTLCTLGTEEDICTAKHAEFCLASCRVRTTGVSEACGVCLIDQGSPIRGFVSGSFSYCATGGASSLAGCEAVCDDGGAAGPAPTLAASCTLTCELYMQDHQPLACSSEGSALCRQGCAAAIAGRDRQCAQCLIEQTLPTRSCINDECDCEPQFDDQISFGCEDYCDDQLP